MTFKLINETMIQRLDDGAFIPVVAGNRDYEDYLAWVALGNQPQPADPPPPPDTRRAQFIQACQDLIDDGATPPKLKAFVQILRALQ